MDWPCLYVTPALIEFYGTVLWSTIGPTWRSQWPSLTVLKSSYCSELNAGSIGVTLKHFWIVCYSSLYNIGCSLIDLIPELGHTLAPIFWLLWSDHTLSTSWDAETLGDPYAKKSPLPPIGATYCLPVSPSIPSHQILDQSHLINRLALPHMLSRRLPLE